MLILTGAVLLVCIVAVLIDVLKKGPADAFRNGDFLAFPAATLFFGGLATIVMCVLSVAGTGMYNMNSIDVKANLYEVDGKYFTETDDGDYNVYIESDEGIEKVHIDMDDSDARVVYTEGEPSITYACGDSYVGRWITYPFAWGEKGVPECGYDIEPVSIIALPVEEMK